LIAPERQVEMNAEERGKLYWGFYHWLERTSGKEAAEAFEAIHAASVFPEAYQEELAKAAAWLEAQSC